MYTHDFFYYNKCGNRGLRLSINRFVQTINVSKTYIRIKNTLPRLKWYITITIQRSV